MTLPKLVEADREQHAALLDNLLALYYYDFAEILEYDIGKSGSYSESSWAWDAPGERIWLLFNADLPAGFAITNPGSVIDERTDVWDLQEFFVLRRWRRRGLGRWLAHAVWRRQPATWDVRVVQPNLEALAFWRDVVAVAAGRRIEPKLVPHPESGTLEHLFRFEPDALLPNTGG